MADIGEVTMWTGREVLDANGETIGVVDDVRYGDRTLGLTWLVVKSGLLGTKKTLVPVAAVRREGDRLVMEHDKDFVRKAPEIGHDAYLLSEEEERVCTYYGLDYASSLSQAREGCVEKGDEGPTSEDGS